MSTAAYTVYGVRTLEWWYKHRKNFGHYEQVTACDERSTTQSSSV